MPHSLVIDATRLLTRVAIGLARQGHTVTVVARDSDDLVSLGEHIGATRGRFNAVHHDYRDTMLMIEKLDAAAAVHGPYDHALSNINDLSAPQATGQIAQFLDTAHHICHFWDILGCDAADPGLSDDQRSFRARRFAERLNHVIYHEVILGWKLTDERATWLSQEDIASGILGAMDSGSPSTIIGTITPWETRPRG